MKKGRKRVLLPNGGRMGICYPFIQLNIQANQPWLRLTSPHVPLCVLAPWLACSTCRWSLEGMGSDRSWNVSFVDETCNKSTRVIYLCKCIFFLSLQMILRISSLKYPNTSLRMFPVCMGLENLKNKLHG